MAVGGLEIQLKFGFRKCCFQIRVGSSSIPGGETVNTLISVNTKCSGAPDGVTAPVSEQAFILLKLFSKRKNMDNSIVFIRQMFETIGVNQTY